MSDLFEMLNMIMRRRKAAAGSPFATVKATEKWLKGLVFDSDYDTHHALVEGIERFNAEHEPATAARMKILLRIEAAGLPLQHAVVEQYVRNQSAFRLARQALWRETWSYWMQMADAWLDLLKQACRDAPQAGLRPHIADIAVRALFHARQTMRWEFHQSRTPAASAWRRVNRIYRLIERDGSAQQMVMLDGKETSCAREYALTVMMGLVNPLGYRPGEIESIAALIEACRQLPLPAAQPLRHSHTHVVDLSLDEGASVIGGALIEGKRLRYFGLRGVLDTLKSDQTPESQRELARQVASLMERGGVRRNRHRSHRFGSAWVTLGIDNILAVLTHPDASDRRLSLEPWMLRDESTEGMGLILPEPRAVPNGRLLAVNLDPAENTWQILATRWMREEDGHHQVGAERLSRHPKRVEILLGDAEAAGTARHWGVLLPMTSTERGMSNLLIPAALYREGAALSLRDGDVAYRLRLGGVQENHENWLRVGMEVVGREQVAVAA
ncbi:MAG: hypothetical protein AB1720_10190 [Pseudomonadota bacterium]